MNRENSIQPFPGRKIQLVYLANGNIRISWKHPGLNLWERIIAGIFLVISLIFWSQAIPIPLKQLRVTIFVSSNFSLNYFLDYLALFISVILRVIVVAFLLFGLFFMLFWLIDLLLSSFIGIGGTGYSQLSLNNYELIYQEGKDPLYLNSKEKYLSEEKSQYSPINDIYDAFASVKIKISNWKQIIFGKPTIAFPKKEIQDIQIESIENRLKLFIIINNQKIAVGKYLYNSEKQWLYQIINQWLSF
ncbi:hypothetical protein NIES267_50620 [Calothrix parasitica NIES-267]|uniref:Uncharacterized protein n=1 Tax=Calothrix parasitica NIES-267 TaxID=1973488 RepID=A0A1Z4LWF4_9CYAN|nr:hypothetical protein NIES267_50620 [Calothrix parasitica NIES-267]